MVKTWIFVYAIGQLLLLIQGLFAAQNMMLTPSMMREQDPTEQGIPFVAHGGMWMDGLCLTPLLATLVAMFGVQWSGHQVAVAAGAGLVMSAAMHFSYILAPYPEAHVQGGRLTSAGWTHLFYMALAFAAIILFYTSTSNVPPTIVLLTSFYLVGHVLVGGHFPLKLLAPKWFPPYPAWDLGTWGPVFGSAAVLAGASWFALR